MADISNIKLNPDQMAEKATQFDARCDEFNQVVTNMRNMVTSLCDEWAGQSSQAFYDQFQSLEPSFTATSELITTIAQQLRDVSAAMQGIDQEIAGNRKRLTDSSQRPSGISDGPIPFTGQTG